MPRRLTLRATLVMIALAFSAALAIQAFAAGSPAAKRAVAPRSTPAADVPAQHADLTLTAAGRAPVLRDPIKPKPKPKPKPARAPAPRSTPDAATVAPSPTPTPTATATPRSGPTPAPQYVAPRRTPAPRPAPTQPPEPSGSFDTSGDTDGTGSP